MKTALIMEGGAMRGMFTCGVIDVLMRHGITFDGAGGISENRLEDIRSFLAGGEGQ